MVPCACLILVHNRPSWQESMHWSVAVTGVRNPRAGANSVCTGDAPELRRAGADMPVRSAELADS
jgi:hypothetical protein